jgi:hypothetical protein
MRHDIHGTIQFGQDSQKNVLGVGYLEKDWGQSFPSTWIWGQTNQWISTSSVSASLFFSFAVAPIGFGLELPGFLVIFEHNNEFYYFNTYLLSIVDDLAVNNYTNSLSFTVYDLFFEYKLHVSIQFDDANSGTLLYAPREGRMEKIVKEMLDNNAYFDVRFSKLTPTIPMIHDNDSSGQHEYQEDVLFQSRTEHVAFEIHGDTIWLSKQFHRVYSSTYSWCFSLVKILIQYYRFILILITSVLVLLVI